MPWQLQIATTVIDEEYKLLTEFNGTVLAGREMDGGYGMKLVTWDCKEHVISAEMTVRFTPVHLTGGIKSPRVPPKPPTWMNAD